MFHSEIVFLFCIFSELQTSCRKTYSITTKKNGLLYAEKRGADDWSTAVNSSTMQQVINDWESVQLSNFSLF